MTTRQKLRCNRGLGVKGLKIMKKTKIKKGSRIQSLLFSKEFFGKSEAKSWAKKHGFVYAKVDTTKNYHRLRQYSPTHIKVVGTNEIADGVLAVYGLPKKGYSF